MTQTPIPSSLQDMDDVNADDMSDSSDGSVAIAASPIAVIVSPSGHHTAEAGATIELSVIVHNRGLQNALIDVYLNDVSQVVTQWCSHPFQRLALVAGQSSEVLFQLQVPPQALPSPYPYQIVVDAPDHYPEETPVQYDQIVQVIPTYQASVEVNDPTFTVQPITRSNQPMLLQPGGSVEVTLTVYNRADRVDRFRLSCPDLDPRWYRVRYPEGFETIGVVLATDSLELNPRSHGEIRLTITLPPEALAGQHTPTLRLHSANHPDLALLDILYLDIAPHHLLTTELKTLVSSVKYQAGLYWVRLSNGGNTARQLRLRARLLDEASDLCRFHWADVAQDTDGAITRADKGSPSGQAISPTIRVLPNESITMSLGIQPYPARKRSLWGGGQLFNFMVELEDDHNLPLVQESLQGSLIWQPRPWWHLALLLLLGAGMLTLIGFPLWLAFRPPAPAEILEFSSADLSYQESEGKPIRVSWQISQPKQVKTVDLVGRSPEDESVMSPTITFDFSEGIPPQLTPFCISGTYLVCQNVPTDAYRAGTYQFELDVSTQRGHRYQRNTQTLTRETAPITILPKPLPDIMTFEPTQARYALAIAPTGSDDSLPSAEFPTSLAPPIRLNWAIAHPSELQKLILIGRDDDQSPLIAPIEFDFSRGIPRELEDYCQLDAVLACWNIPTPARDDGHYTFELQAFSRPEAIQPDNEALIEAPEPIDTQITDPISIERPDLSFTITSFQVNGESAQAKYVIPLNVEDVLPVIPISWSVSGDPDVTVELLPSPGTVPLQGAIAYPLSPQGGIETLTLRVTSLEGETISRSVTIETVPPPPISPDDSSQSSPQLDRRSPNADSNRASSPPTDSIHTPRPTEPDRLSPAEVPPRF
ncbi:MAG: hypothetical protein AAFR31_00030 [Cyanobacteria bacterium J06627_8]